MVYNAKIYIIHIYLDEHIYISDFFKFIQIESNYMLYCSHPFLYNMLGEFFHLNRHVSAVISKDYYSVQMLAYPILVL